MLMTKYILRVRRLLFFIKRMMERRFTVTIATHSAVNTVNKMKHSDKEIIILSWVISPMVLLFLEFVLSEYAQIHAASAKAFVLYKKNYGKEVHRYYSNTRAVDTVNKMKHSDKEIIILSWVISPMVLLFLEFVLSATVTCKKNNLWSVFWSKERSAS